jgi:two-component system NtrC family sensor kinase
MAAVLAHEIRNPLGAIKGLAQFLAEKAGTNAPQAEMTQAIAGEATRLERLVNDLLTYARPRAPKVEPTKLVGVLREVLAMARTGAETQGATLQLQAPDEGVEVRADPEQLKQVISNLVLNGLQAMPRGGTLVVAVRLAESPHRHVEARVTDTGSGIPDADLPRIFDPFYTTRTKGTGLGLAICRQIVEAHGGTIGVEQTGPTGTTILFTLPTEAPDHG